MSELQTEIAWAHRYDGYARLARTAGALGGLIEPARRAWRTDGWVPEWCGVDFLRGWAFYLAREDRFAGGGSLGAEWDSVLAAVRAHPDAGGADRPPPRGLERLVLPTSFSTEPKLHRNSDFLAAKQDRLWEAHIAPVNQLVDHIKDDVAARRRTAGEEERPVFVPYVDPDSGGVRGRVLFLLESPAGPAALGSGMLSADNDDETAKNVWHAYVASGMPRTFGLHWNAVPWYVGDGKRNRAVTHTDVEQGRAYLHDLLDLAPAICVVLALGKPAQRSVMGATRDLEARGIRVIAAPHPSPIPAASTRGRSLKEFKAAVRLAYEIAEEGAHRD